jgi:predicted regulator of Ras-like GTPase activity (Roadblock/LC7/MglB family)
MLGLIMGVSAAALLLTAGYLFGAKRGYQAREQLLDQNLDQVEELRRLQEQLALKDDHPVQGATAELKVMIEALLRQGDALQRTLEPLLQRDKDAEALHTTIQQVLTPLLQQVLTPLTQRDRLSFALANLQTGSGRRGDLLHLVDQIAEKGGFVTVLLSDEEGLPLAASSNARDLERLAAISSLSLLVADRLAQDKAPTPLAVMVHDAANKLTLCRIFRIGDQRLLLTAVSTDSQLMPTILDPALAKLDILLSS